MPGAVEVQGSDTDEHKEKAIEGFLNGSIRVIVSKPKIIGLGLNFQHCADMAYVGLSDSYEQLYQSIRRCWRFGQTNPVNVHVITAETEGAVVSNIKRKEREAEETYNNMIEHMKDLNAAALHGGTVRNKTEYAPSVEMVIPDFLRIAA
jgi:SNF2 family DNA or RNA helicase